jgi:PleD family two-component response regulator
LRIFKIGIIILQPSAEGDIYNSDLEQSRELLAIMARILWIEGKRAESPQFVSGVRKAGYQVEVVSTGKDALEQLPAVDPDLVVLNAIMNQ